MENKDKSYLTPKGVFMSFVESKIVPRLYRYEHKRAKLKSLQTFGYIVGVIIFVILSLAEMKYNLFHKDELEIIFVFSAIPTIIIHFFINRYVKQRKDEILPLCFSYLGKFKNKQTFITEDYIKRSKIYQSWNTFQTDESFQGQFGDTEFSLLEATIKQKNRKKNEIIFSGSFIAIKMHKKVTGHSVAINCNNQTIFDELNIFEKTHAGLESVEIEDGEFMNEYQIYSNNQIEIRYILTPAFIERLKELKKVFNASRVDMAFFNGYALLGVHTGNLFDTFTINNPVTDTSIFSSFYDEMKALGKLIETLKIDNVN